MSSGWKAWLLPPALHGALKKLRNLGQAPMWQWAPKGFEAAGVAEPELAQQNTLLAYAYAVARASEGKQSLRLLDWGGGLGHYAPLTRSLFPGLKLDYTCFDQPLFCRAGRDLLPQDRFMDAPAQGDYRGYLFKKTVSDVGP